MTYVNRQKRAVLAVLLLAVSLVVVVNMTGDPRPAEASTYYFDIRHGFSGAYTANYLNAWHNDESYCTSNGYYCPSIDLNIGGNTGGATAYFQHSGNRSVLIYAYAHEGYWTSCVGTDLWMYDASTYASLGQEHYVHMTPSAGINGSSWTAFSGSGTKVLGTVHSSASCAYWTGPHLHQSGLTTGHPLSHNSSLSGSGTVGSSTYLHRADW